MKYFVEFKRAKRIFPFNDKQKAFRFAVCQCALKGSALVTDSNHIIICTLISNGNHVFYWFERDSGRLLIKDIRSNDQ